MITDAEGLGPATVTQSLNTALAQRMSRASLRKQVAKLCILIAVTIALSMPIPKNVFAAGQYSKGVRVSINGVLHFTVTDSCATQTSTCSSSQEVIPYLAVPNGDNFILLGGKANIWPDGQKMVVTGWVTSPTASAPDLTFAGTIIVTSIYAHCHMHNQT